MDEQESSQEAMKQVMEMLMEEAAQTRMRPLSDAMKALKDAADRLEEVNKKHALALEEDEKPEMHAAIASKKAEDASKKVELAHNEEKIALDDAWAAYQRAIVARQNVDNTAEVVETHMDLVYTAAEVARKARHECCERVADLLRSFRKSAEFIEAKMSELKSVCFVERPTIEEGTDEWERAQKASSPEL